MALFFLIIVGLNFLYLLPLKAERVDSLPGCGDRNCATNPTDAVIANDSTFILIVDSSPFPFIRRFDFNGTVFNNSTLINLKENNPNKIPLKIGLNKNNNKSFVYKTPSGTDKGSVQIINLTNNSVKLLISPTSGGKQLDSIGFIDPDGKKLIACVSDSKNSELLIIDIDTDTVESNVSLPDKASSIAVSTNFTKAVIAFKSTFSQSIGLYDIQSGKIIRLDTPINIFFKIDDFIARDDFDLNGNISVLSTVSGAHALSYLNLKENNLTVKILDKNTQGQSIATISRDGTLAIVAGAVLNSPTGFRIYKIDLTNSNFPIITEASFSDGTSVIDVDITPDQNKVILLLKKDTGKILRILNINDFSKISDVFVANDNSKNVLAVDPRGNFAIAINQNGSIPASIITDFAAGPIIRSITPNFGSINGGTLFTIDGLLDLNRFTSKDVKICFKDLNTCASSVEVSADGRTIKGITPKMEKEGIENIILVAESKVNECSSTEKCVSCSEITCTQGQTKTTGTCCECPKCIYNTSTYKDIFDFRNDIAISDTIPPKIKITKPTIPIATNKKEIKLEGEIDGTGSPVETLTINNESTKTTQTEKANIVTFSANLKFEKDNSYLIKLSTKDKAGNLTEENIEVIVDTVEPKLLNIKADRTVNGDFNLSGTADGTGSNIVKILINNVNLNINPGKLVDFSTTTNNSPAILKITDAAGNVFSTSVNILNGTNEPIITFLSPKDSNILKSRRVIVKGTVDGNNSEVKSLTINNSNTSFTRQSKNKVIFSRLIEFNQDGLLDITAIATNKDNLTATRTIMVRIDSVIPSATASAEFTQDGKIKVSGSADGTGSNISSISVNNVQAQFSQTPTSDFSVSITPSSSILLTIIDAAGNRFSQQVPFSEKIPPAITITTPSDLQAFKSKSIRVSGIVDGTGSPVTSVLINNIRAGFSSSKQPLNSVSFNGSVSFTKDGSFDVTVSATDKAGNSSNKPIKVIIDSVIPSATASAEFTQDGKIKVSGSADGTGSNISSISVNNVQAQFSQTPTSDFSVSITPSSSILLTIIDAAGNINKKNLQIILPPDIIPPIITLNNLTDLEILNSRDIKVGGLVNGTGSKIVLLTINGNKAATTQTNDPNIVNFTEIISFKNDGLQTITIAAKDKDNNSSKKSISITIDTVLPDITSFNIDTNDKDEFVLDTTLSGTGTDLVSLSIKDDKNNPITFTPAFTPSSSFSLTAISPTSDTFIIEATDKAGNKLTKTLKTSGAAPTIDVSKPFDNAFFNVSDILTEGSVTFSAPKKVFKINDTDVNLSSTPDPSVFTFKKTLTFMDGTHTITFLAKDKLLRSSSTSRTITIDTLLPIVNATVVRSNNNFTINGSAEGTGSNIIIIEINGNSLAITEAEKVDFNLTVESPQVSIKVKDKAGNETTKSFEPVDQTPPKITINAPKKAFFYGTRKIRVIAKIEDDTSIKKVFVNEKEIDLTNTSGNNSGKRMSYQITNNPNNELKIFNLSVDEVINTEGNTKIKITAIDTSNNQSEETIDFIVDSINPEFNVNVKPESGGTYTVSGSANGTGSKIISIEINGQSIDITPDAVINFSGTADKTPLTVRVFDSAGNQTEQTINAQLPDTTPPNIKIISPNNGDVFTDTTNININFTAEDNIQLKEVTLNSNNIQPVSEFNYSANVTLLPGDNLFTVIATDTSNNTATSTISISYSPPPPRKSIGGGGGGGGGGGLVLTLPPPIISPNTSIFEGVLEPVSNNELPETVEVANPPATRDGKKADISIVPTVQGLELKRTDDNLLLIPQGCSFATIIKPLAEIIKITDEELNNKYATILIDSTGRTFLAGFAFFIKSKQDIQSNEPIFISSDDTPLKLITTLQIPPEANEGNTRVSIIGSKGTLATINIIIETDIEVKTRRRSNELDKPKIVGTIKATIKKLNNKFTVLILKIHADNLLNKIAIIDGKIVKIRGERNSLTRLSFIPEEGIKIKSSVLKNKKSLRTVIKLEDDIELGIKLFNITTPKCADIGAIIIPKELNKGSLEASDNPESLILEDFIKAQNALSEKKNKQVEDKEESIESEIDDEGEYLEEFKNID